jgi:class 3 adenylate cyclase/tetratricopeptide (TPR) repeat protein
VECSACGTDNDAERKFCMECGTPLARTGPSCGTENPPRSKFCGECGSALAAGTGPDSQAGGGRSPSPAAAVGGTERRLVSVLFLDLVSFTTLSEQRDAEDMRALMDQYFATARTVIERHGGVVEKFIGDAVMAVWGTPITNEDDAERAVRAALELVDAVAALGSSVGVPLAARAGVLTGEAATAPDAQHQGMVTGDMVNTAARLQSAADPGAVLVGEATFRAASGAVAFQPVGELELKGKDEPVRAWSAQRVIAERHGHNRMAIEPPFVGRSEELRLLKELLHATGRENRARLVSVMGVGGIGKSRLAWELAKYIDGLTEDVYWHQGRCPSYGEGITFWALGEMVRMRAGIAETDSPATSRAKLGESIEAHVPDEDDRRWLAPRLAFLLGLAERPAGGREELFAAWRTFFERISDSGTVVMVFEDLQWADPGLLDFIDALLEWSRGTPILLVTLSRPDLLDRRENWGVGQRSFVGLHLEPLDDDDMADLVRGMVPGADEGSVRRVVDRAEGMPLYAVETLRMLADRGVLRVAEDAYEVCGDLGEISVPETLHALIASRLDALGTEDRAVVQKAAVLGKSFTIDSLVAVTRVPREQLEPLLQDLVRKEFLAFEADPRSPERGQYAFVQSIIREVAYGMLSKADRRAQHLAAAHHFEAIGDDELASVVATHYVEALHATAPGPDADALAARAKDGLGRAAERARALGSPKQSLVYLEQALELTPTGPKRAALLTQAADTAEDALHRDDSIRYRREAVAVLAELDDRNAEVTALGSLARTIAAYDKGELRSLVAQIEARMPVDADDLAQAGLDNARAWVSYYEGAAQAGLESIDRAMGGYERARAWRPFASALMSRSVLLVQLGRFREATLLARGRLAVALEGDDLHETAYAYESLAFASDEGTDFFENCMRSAEVARRGGYGELELSALTNGLEAAIEIGQWERASEIISELRSRADLTGSLLDNVLLGEALLEGYRGHESRARAALAEVSGLTRDASHPQLRAWLRRIEAVVDLMAGQLDAALAGALAALRADPSGPNTPMSLANAGQAALWLRDPGRARAVLSVAPNGPGIRVDSIRRALGGIEAGLAALEGRPHEAASTFESLLADRCGVGDEFGHARLTVDAATVLPAELVPQDALVAARAHLEQLGAAPLLARLDAAVAALR